MDEFLRDYVSMLVESVKETEDEDDTTYKELDEGDYNDIINIIKNDDSIWDAFDYAILDILEGYKNE